MENRIFYRIVEELGQQCRFAQLAFQALRTSLNALDAQKTFFYTHSFLAHAAHVSRLLWPTRDASQARGQRLRNELKVSPNSPLQMREIRPQLEPSDERFEDWVSASGRDYVDMNIMPQGTMAEFKPDNFHRSLDPDTYKLHLRGEPSDLRALADELRRLEAAAQTWLRTHNPW